MKKFRNIGAAALVCAGATFAQTDAVTAEPQAIKAALIVQNHVTDTYAQYMSGLTDLLTAELADRGILVINPATVIGENQNAIPQGEIMPAASAKNLANMLGADYLITASFRSVGSKSKGAGDMRFTTLTLRMTMSIADGADGTVFAGESITVDSPRMTAQSAASNLDETFNEMLDMAATECADRFVAKLAARGVKPPDSATRAQVTFTGNVPGANILIDGVSFGTLPAVVSVPAGIHNVVVEYPFCMPFASRAMLTDGQVFNAQLELSPEGYARWRDKETFLTIIERVKASGATDDYVRRVIADGKAEALHNSFFKWDGALQTLTIERAGNDPIVYGPTTVLKK